MKYYLLTLLLLLTLSAVTLSQVPQGIPYQAVARDAQGQPLSNRSIQVRFSILDSTVTGAAVYRETHATTTSALGLFALNVGMGTPSIGTFSNINWGVNSKFMKVELDTTGSGSSYVDLGTQQMMSVPYALYAGNVSANNFGQSFYGINNLSSQISSKTFWQAINYCASLTESGFSDWRLPSLDDIYNWISVNGTPVDGLQTWTKTISNTKLSWNENPEYFVVSIDGTTLNGATYLKVAQQQNFGYNYSTYDVTFPFRCIR